MDKMVCEMFRQLNAEQTAEENGKPRPDMPDMSKLINQVTKQLFQNENMKALLSQEQGDAHIQTNKPKLLTHKITVTLKELYNGAHKEIKMKRQVWKPDHNKLEWERTCIPISISRGMRYKDTILIEGVGDMYKDMIAGDLQVTLVPAKETGIFEIYNKDNLKVTIDVNLCELYQWKSEIEHIDGQPYTLVHTNDSDPLNGLFRVLDMGMPMKDGTWGDLFIDVHVTVPDSKHDFNEQVELFKRTPKLETDNTHLAVERVSATEEC